MPIVNDYLSRALARRDITEKEYDAGRYWQALESDAAGGDVAAKETLDNLDLDAKWSLGWKRHQLLRDVLLCEEAPGLPSPLAQAAAKRTMKSTTSSRHMKALGRDLRHALRQLAGEVARVTKDVRQRAEERKKDNKFSVIERAFGGDTYLQTRGLGGIAVSSPETDKREREFGPQRSLEQKFYSVSDLASARGYRIFSSLDEYGDPREGLFDLFANDGFATNCRNRALDEIEAVLKRVPIQQKRKRGARGRAPVTLPKINF